MAVGSKSTSIAPVVLGDAVFPLETEPDVDRQVLFQTPRILPVGGEVVVPKVARGLNGRGRVDGIPGVNAARLSPRLLGMAATV